MSHKISVITPSLNSARYIEYAIKSVLEQDYSNFEHIVVDGLSTDATLEILKKYSHLRWISEADRGQSDAMNKGFQMSTGDIVVYLNVDDYFLPGAFHTVAPFFDEGAKFVVGKVKVILEDGTSWINDPRTTHRDILRHWEPEAFPVNPVGYFYLREVQERVGGFNLDNDFAMDLEFLMAASKYYELTKISSVLGCYRFLQGTKTVELQKKPAYWTTSNLFFIEQFLADMPDDEVRRFNIEREKGYEVRKLDSITMNVAEAFRKRQYLSGLYWGLLLFLSHPDKIRLIKDKFAGLLR